jgi:hypothetical protein
MQVGLRTRLYDFRPWKPSLGAVFRGAYAFDCETTRIDGERPWLTPAYVIGAAFDGANGYFIRRDDAGAFFAAHAGLPVVFHNAAFDLAVLHTLAPDADVYRLVERKRVWDTQLLHRLYALARVGHTAGGKGQSTLEACAARYLKVRLPKDVADAVGDPVRLSYGKWLNRPPGQIEPVYLEYLAKDVIATLFLYRRLRRLLRDSRHVWGFVSEAWLCQQVRCWGEQTHHIQLRGAVVLTEITRNGLHLDRGRRDKLERGLTEQLGRQREALRAYGYLAGGTGSDRSLQAVLGRLAARHPELSLPRTATGRLATARDVLKDVAERVPFVKLLLEYRATEKLMSSFVGKMGRGVLHPSFNVLVRSGRTSSFGEINAQNLPVNDRVRSCIVPSPGHVFLDADYTTIELVTLAQACLTQLGLSSEMAKAINAGRDLHTLVAARVTGKPEGEVTTQERKKAKPINFGKQGAMGERTLQEYVRATYGVHLDDAEVRALSDAWLDLFPEMRSFLANTSDPGAAVAVLLGLTPAAHYEHTGDGRFLNHPENAGGAHRPHPILGGMCLKVLAVERPTTRAGKPYPDADLDYFWSCVAAPASRLGPALRHMVQRRQPSPRLRRAVLSLADRAGVFTLTGRLRAAATFSARHNTVFQGLAADGAKLALWRLWRAGYRLVNFVHDQVLVEVPAGADLRRHAARVRRLMVRGMRAVVPDVRVDVAIVATDRWSKDAAAVCDGAGGRPPVGSPGPPAGAASRAAA